MIDVEEDDLFAASCSGVTGELFGGVAEAVGLATIARGVAFFADFGDLRREAGAWLEGLAAIERGVVSLGAGALLDADIIAGAALS